MQFNYKKESVYPIIIPANNPLKSYNFFLYKTDTSLILIDAGMDSSSCWEGLQTILQANGFSLEDLTAILLTHHHIDHVGLINRIASAHSVPVYAHHAAVPRLLRNPEFMEERVMFFQSFYRESGCGDRGEKQVSYLLHAIKKNKDQKLEADLHTLDTNNADIYGLNIVETPGHAPDQVAYYHKEAKWLFGGDLLISHISSNALIEYIPEENKPSPLIDHMNSYQVAERLPVDIVFPGHGEPIEDHQKLIHQRIQGIKEKAEKLKSLISKGIQTPNGLAQTFYPKRYDAQFPLVMSEITGHLEYLRADKQIVKHKLDGVWHYNIAN